jgi:hypothetical protein
MDAPSLSPVLQEAVTAFRNESMERMVQANAADEPAQPIFHYTTEKALFSIIETETFWFTSIYHMDDKEELIFGFNICRSLSQAIAASGDDISRMFYEEFIGEDDLSKIRSLFEFYSISFGVKDDAQQWAKYADGGRGVALGLKPEFFHPAPFEDPENPKPEEHIYFGKVLYGEDAARRRHSVVLDRALEVIHNLQNNGAIRNGRDAMHLFRHMAVEMMVEVLWNCVTTKDESWTHQNEIRFLALNNLKTPHLKIHNKDVRSRVELPQPQLKKHIAEIMIGPNADPSMEEKIKRFLDLHDLGHVPITSTAA